MVWLKECPRCQGDLFLDRDHYGEFKTCVQCGYMKDLVEANANETLSIASGDGTHGISFKAFTAMQAAD